MGDDDLNLVEPGDAAPPDEPDSKTQEELNKLKIGQLAEDYEVKRVLRIPVLVLLIFLVLVAVGTLVASGIDSLHFHPNPGALTAFITGVFASCLVVALKWLFK